MAYTPTLPPFRESIKPYGCSPMSEIAVPAVLVVPTGPALMDTRHHVRPTAPPALPILPILSPAVGGDGDFRPPESLYAERTAQPPLPRAQTTRDWVPESAPPTCPEMPKGVQLIRWEPKAAPVAIDVCSVVVDVPKFIESELRALDSRLNNPWTIHGGFTVPQMLDRLAQAGMDVELDPKGGANE